MSSSMPISSLIFSRYAGALIDLAEQGKAVDKVHKDLSSLGKAIESSDELQRLISSPLVSSQKQADVINEIAKKAKFNDMTKNFIGVLSQNRRLGALPGIIISYGKMVAAKSGQVEVSLETAAKLSSEQLKEFETKVGTALGTSIILEEKVSPEIMGGMIVTIGSYMIDDSVRRKLERLGMALKSNANQNTVKNLKEVV